MTTEPVCPFCHSPDTEKQSDFGTSLMVLPEFLKNE
jgi:hypothetical protein